jgi:hypothetical protein
MAVLALGTLPIVRGGSLGASFLDHGARGKLVAPRFTTKTTSWVADSALGRVITVSIVRV